MGSARTFYALSFAVLVVSSSGCASHSRGIYRGYDPQTPAKVSGVTPESLDSHERTAFSFEGRAGAEVPALLLVPKAAARPVPCIVFLHGFDQDRHFVETIAPRFIERGFAMASFDQLMSGERSLPEDTGSLKTFGAIRRRLFDTVFETRRLIDYCESRSDIDGGRIYLMGASFGAITGAAAAACDPRIRACVLTYGGGSIRKLLSGPEITESIGFLGRLAKPLAILLLRRGDPARHIHRVSPRPILFQNGTQDRLIAPGSAKALHEAARPPKTILWYDSAHIGEDDPLFEKVLGDALDWLIEQDCRNVFNHGDTGHGGCATEGSTGNQFSSSNPDAKKSFPN